jgi:hypothetical protein
MSNALETALEAPATPVGLVARSGDQEPHFLPVDHDGFTIGSGARCDLVLAGEFPKLHSVLHVQGRAVWIEAAREDAALIIEGESFRRRALRDGDRLTFGAMELTVHVGEGAFAAARLAASSQRRIGEELSLLSAEELCDRIEQEERLVAEFEEGRRTGFEALVTALREILHQEEHPTIPLPEDALDSLVTQVRGLSETIEERTKALSEQEAHLIESSSQLCQAQLRISRQLEQLIDRLGDHDDPRGELRVSA